MSFVKLSNDGQCPYCGSVRFSVSQACEDGKEEHRFCRICDNEYMVMSDEKEINLAAKK